jgi:serine/threonine protein kinase
MAKYSPLSEISSGAYGTITKAKCLKDNSEYAIKRNFIDPSLDFCGSLKELDILQETCEHPHIVSLEEKMFDQSFDSVPPKTRKKGLKNDNFSFVMPLAKGDCHHIIYQNSLDTEHVRWCACNILLAVEYLHRKNIIHRDIKPGNILWFDAHDKSLFGTLALCDFGMAKRSTSQHKNSPRVITCWYRAPEVCKGDDYDSKVDCWSVGCVLYEMIMRKPLVSSKDDDKQILTTISNNVPQTRDQWRRKLRDSEFVELLEGLLQQDPSQRCSANEALNMDLFEPYRDYISALRCQFPPNPLPKYNERKIDSEVFTLAFQVFNKRKEYCWYSHRALFLAIDLMTRYFALMNREKRQRHTVRGTRLRFLVCLYLSVKYFSRGRCKWSFSEIAAKEVLTSPIKEFAQKFETFLVEKALKPLYRENIFERQRKALTDKEVEDLLKSMG